jgi:hypothetical protein
LTAESTRPTEWVVFEGWKMTNREKVIAYLHRIAPEDATNEQIRAKEVDPMRGTTDVGLLVGSAAAPTS